MDVAAREIVTVRAEVVEVFADGVIVRFYGNNARHQICLPKACIAAKPARQPDGDCSPREIADACRGM
jgi:hypothetical protein